MKQQRIALVLLSVIAVPAMAWYWWNSGPSIDKTLPKVSEIREMKVFGFSSFADRSIKHVTFDVPKDHWENILAALLPARFDTSPSKWEYYGDVKGTKKNGDSFYIGLYSLGEPIGAFSAGLTQDTRRYYRGGDSSGLDQAVRNAYLASKQ